MAKYIIVVDAQNDFITGNLGSDEAFDAYFRIEEYLKNLTDDINIIFTMDIHDENYLETYEGKKLPVPHCLKNSWGQKIPTNLRKMFNSSPYIVKKDTFGSFHLPIVLKETFNFNEEEDIIEIFGFCTDICVIANALILRTAFPNVPINVVANLCAGTSPINHVNALEVMKSCQIDVSYLGHLSSI